MPEVTGVGGGGVSPQNQNQISDQAVKPVTQANTQTTGVNMPVGQPGALGQPVGLPVPLPPGQTVLPDVLAGRDPSQLLAAERLRSAGGASATEELLGLNLRPTVLGALVAPPGNSEALRHMTPTMRRAVMRSLLDKQREKMRRLARMVRRERDGGGREQSDEAGEQEQGSFSEELYGEPLVLEEAQITRVQGELGSAARMLDLLDELLAMQDYTISQMGTFSQG